MRIEGKEYRTIWYEKSVVKIIDQTKLPHNFVIKELPIVFRDRKDGYSKIPKLEIFRTLKNLIVLSLKS